MVENICEHTNSYAYAHVADGGHEPYTEANRSWRETTPDEINKLTDLLIYFGLVKVQNTVEKYWIIQHLYHGLWARAIMCQTRYKALVAFCMLLIQQLRTLCKVTLGTGIC